jgi:ubiquinone/menaquinone biosynthesis C-methylase UbiE
MPYVLLGLALLVAALLYWQLVVAEGAHLGARVVVWLYDLVAPRYDRLKQFDLDVEAGTLGLPLTQLLAEVPVPLVLDVACGTSRLARALLPQIAFDGVVINADLSARMLRQGRPHLAPWPGRAAWLRAPVGRLPFAAGTFHAVACLEALEFTPDPRASLAECVRVLRPGGILVVTNRIGLQARLIPGKTFSRPAFQHLLTALPLAQVEVLPWQEEYDLAFARKRAESAGVV